jgi:hypothetical protein
MIGQDELTQQVHSLREELIGVLWDLVSQGDVQEVGDLDLYGHMFRSDLEYATARLVELGQAVYDDGDGQSKHKYWIRATR